MRRVLYLLLLLPSSASAEVVTYDFTGVFDSGSDNWFAFVGDSFSGRFSYDTTTPFSNAGIVTKTFPYPVITPPIEFRATIVRGDLPLVELTAFSEPPNNVLNYRLANSDEPSVPGVIDIFNVQATRVFTEDSSITPIVFDMNLLLLDGTGTKFVGNIGMLPSTLPALTTLFDARFAISGGSEEPFYRLAGPLTSLTQVPEPATIWLLALSLVLIKINPWQHRRARA